MPPCPECPKCDAKDKGLQRGTGKSNVKPERKKRKPREKCFRGVYVEGFASTKKFPKEEVSCSDGKPFFSKPTTTSR